ncbi:MAG: hypothetical protein AB1695_14325 [Stygiobacter sp.]
MTNQSTHKHVILQHWDGKLFALPKYVMEQNANLTVFRLCQVISEVDVPYPPLGSQTLSQYYEDRNKQAVEIYWNQKIEKNI